MYESIIKASGICSSWSTFSSRALLQGDARSGCPGDSANAQATHGEGHTGDTRPRSQQHLSLVLITLEPGNEAQWAVLPTTKWK